ncbi:hypothetical protein XA68_17797 [Ophiocordyceps unilateralis]|uniref:Spindle pole body component n=1 Tax=Ophiocordyceps unilateralis TaxID=268505 RepID=A0A2A9PJ81_OPHUN|nr:hypothetical protein XA68_17797 [Ophiocordyceps unilateralis]
MAFAARLGSLVEDLVQSLAQSTGQSTSSLPASWFPDAVLRKLKTHPYLRTNPFEIEDRLEGLDERFRVNNREALADALDLRLRSLLQHPSQWHPDVLHLLLELSDQPTLKTCLDSLKLLPPSRELPPEDPPLRWEQVAREDGWGQDEDLWKSISYTSDDSAEDDTGRLSAVETSDVTSIPGDETPARSAEDYIIYPAASDALQSVLETQAWRTRSPRDAPRTSTPRIVISELQVVREALFMLHGFECSLFDSLAEPIPAFQMAGTALETHSALMGSLADNGRRMRVIRQFVAQPQTVPHVQALQDCLTRHLADVDRRLSAIQARFASPENEVVVSLIAVMSELASHLEPVLTLSDIVARLQDAAPSDTFRCLELMFDEIGVARLAGKPGTYELLVRAFVECLNIYLRPVQLWMREGKLLPGDEPFFITEPSSRVSLGDTWQARFQIRKTADGRPHAPTFLQPAIGDIYNAGRSMVALRLLGKATAITRPSHRDEPPLDYDALCPTGFELAPFADLFNNAFERWVQSRYRETWATLKSTLVEDWGLFASLDALRALYLMADGRAAATLCEALFARLDSTDADWRDRYVLTTAGREAFASLLDPSRLVISVDPEFSPTSAIGNGTVRAALPGIKVSYRLSWPVQMIVTAESRAHYQSVFTFLLQIKRAMYALHKTRLLDKHRTNQKSRGRRSLFYSTRNKLLWFCATIHTYLATQVLEPTAVQMRRDIDSAQNVDAMIAAQCSGMKRMTEEACLGSELARVRERMLDVMDMAVKFENGQRHATGRDGRKEETCFEALGEMATDLDHHARFVCRELRSVASTSRSRPASAKWDILVDMLQAGVREER